MGVHLGRRSRLSLLNLKFIREPVQIQYSKNRRIDLAHLSSYPSQLGRIISADKLDSTSH